jgi:Ca2+-binding RTX toxin-like protein
MVFSLVSGWIKQSRSERRSCRPRFEVLEDRKVPAVLAFFNDGQLSVLGDAAANNVVVAADSAGVIRVQNNGVDVPIALGSPTTANTRLISLTGDGGNDFLRVDNSVGLIQASIAGGLGDDTLQAGRGNSLLSGDAGNDLLISGFGNDVMLGGAGNDILRWDPGTINDVMEGGTGYDIVQVIGNDTFMGQPANDSFTFRANGSRLRFDRVNLVPFFLDIGTVETVQVDTGAGNDSISVGNLAGVANLTRLEFLGRDGDDYFDASANLNSRISISMDGGAGNDTLIGGAGADLLLGGDGHDYLDGRGGVDVLNGGNGDDTLDGGRDGRQDVLIGGLGADLFIRYYREVRIGGQLVRRYDEVVLDFDTAQGDRTEEIQIV